MRSHRLVRTLSITAGGAAIVAMVGFTAACGNNEKAPETSTTPTTATTTTPSSVAPTTPPAVTPSEKSLDPNGGSLFTPHITASQQYTPSLGHH